MFALLMMGRYSQTKEALHLLFLEAASDAIAKTYY
jgi:hypothetical protein